MIKKYILNNIRKKEAGNMGRKKLYKSSTDKTLAGVCGGIAEYFNIDSTIIRLIWLFFTLAGGSGILVYIIAALVIPEEPKVIN